MNITTERRAGIYMIRNEVTGGRYYGSSVNLARRSREHLSDLRLGKHRNGPLQSSWNEYGGDCFTFSVLAVLERSDYAATETRLLKRFVGTAGCFNLGTVAGHSMLGRRHSAHARQLMVEAAIGRVPTDAARRAMAAAWRPGSSDTFQKISAALKGKPKSAAHAEHCRTARCGIPHTDEVRARISGSLMGNVRSPESLAKRSASMKATLAKKRIDRALRLFAANYIPPMVAA